jgi:predicted ester cyclase
MAVMSETANTQLARRWFEDVWNRRHEATIHELLHPEAVGHLEGVDVHGVAEFLDARASLLGAFPDLHVTLDSVIGSGDDVALRWSARATHRGPELGMAPTDRAVAFRGMSWFRFANGRLVEGWDSWNQGGLLESLKAVA